MRRRSLIALVLAMVAAASTAQAQEPVRWEAPDGCPLEGEFRELVGEVEGPGTARVVVAREPAGWTAWVVIGATVRELVGDSCYELADAAALIVSLALRGIAQGEVADPAEFMSPATPPAVAPPPPVAGDVAVERLLARPSPAPATWSAGTAIGAEVGALPGTAPVVRVGIGVRGRHLAAGVDGVIATGEVTAMRGDFETTTRVNLMAAGARACAGRSWAWLCAGLEAGRMSAVADDGFRRGSGAAPWVAGRVGPSVVLPLADAWELVAQAEVAAPLAYPRFTIGRVPVHDPGGASFRTSLGVQRRFR